MALVRVLKHLGFEQPGDIVDMRANLEEKLAKGEVELLPDGDPRPVINSLTNPDNTPETDVIEVSAEPEGVKEPIVEPVIEPVVIEPEGIVEPVTIEPVPEVPSVEEPTEAVIAEGEGA